MKKLTKKQINAFAIIHSAATLRGTDGFSVMDCDISDKQQQEIVNKIHLIADKLTPIQLHDSFAILEYVIKNVT